MRLVAGALAVLVAALVLALVPLRAQGIAGTAVEPTYTEYSFLVVGELPEQPTDDQLRAAGVALPQDAVRDRRQLVAGLAAVSALLALLGTVRTARASSREPRRGARVV